MFVGSSFTTLYAIASLSIGGARPWPITTVEERYSLPRERRQRLMKTQPLPSSSATTTPAKTT